MKLQTLGRGNAVSSLFIGSKEIGEGVVLRNRVSRIPPLTPIARKPEKKPGFWSC